MTQLSKLSASEIKDYHDKVDSVLCIAFASFPKKRLALSGHFLRHELGAFTADNMSSADWLMVTHRSLFFACQEVLPVLTRRYLLHGDDRLLQEQLNLYIQDKLLQDSFRRIASYNSNKAASFRTYIQHIIHNLALDFLRKRSRELKVMDYYIDIDSSENDSLPEQVDHQQDELAQEPLQWIKKLLDDSIEVDSFSFQQRIAKHLTLTVKERLFLKAIYFSGLTAEEAGQLPGMLMNKNQANSRHRRLLERLADVFKSAGVYAELQQLVYESDGLLEIKIEDLIARVAVAQLILVTKKYRISDCLLALQDKAIAAQIMNEYGMLRKRLYNEMVDIRHDAMAGELFLESLDVSRKQLKLRLVGQQQTIDARFMKRIKAIFTTQKAT